MASRQDRRLPGWFVGYAIAVAALYLGTPRLFGLRYVMPWDYWWVFLIVTPAVAAGLLGLGVRSGRFSGRAVAAFYLAAVVLGLGIGWLSYQLLAVV
jgi:hypothetical protein